jgi:hypothetical protein
MAEMRAMEFTDERRGVRGEQFSRVADRRHDRLGTGFYAPPCPS